MKTSRLKCVIVALIGLIFFCGTAFASDDYSGMTITHRMTLLILELSIIIIFAKAGGYLFSQYLRQPAVLGELCAGMLIGPYALGSIDIPILGPLFTVSHGALPVSPELYGVATIASIVLLFLAGLETDISMFLRYSVAGTVVGIGGVVCSFVFGDLLTVIFGIAPGFMHPTALLVGSVSTATSVGITARILSDRRKLDSPEGVTILSAAVFDDVLGIVILAIVVGISKVSGHAASQIDWARIGMIGAKALGFWLASTMLGLLLARRITSVLKWFKSSDLISSLSLGLALFLAGLSEMAGLAMIIGAYIMGLALSRTDIKHELHEKLHGLHDVLVPVFFCVMGMLVDFRAMGGAVVFGASFTAVMIAAKVIGCGAPALLMNFNWRGALRIGVGMLPRGEVTLIIAGIGLAAHIISSEVFGVCIMMTLITTLIAPELIVWSFEGPAGVTRREDLESIQRERRIALELPSPEIAEFVMGRIAQAFRQETFFVHRIHPRLSIYQMRRDEMSFTLLQDGNSVVVEVPLKYESTAAMIVAEELLELGEMFKALKGMPETAKISHDLMAKALKTP